jgi:hypothetical protein
MLWAVANADRIVRLEARPPGAIVAASTSVVDARSPELQRSPIALGWTGVNPHHHRLSPNGNAGGRRATGGSSAVIPGPRRIDQAGRGVEGLAR